MDNNSYKEIFINKMKGESKKLVDDFLQIPEENITDIMKDAVTYKVNDNEVITLFLNDYLLTCHKGPKLFCLEMISNSNEPIYSYYQTMRGSKNTIFQTGFVKVEKGRVVDGAVQNTIYTNKVIDKYFKKYWEFDKTASCGFHTCFHEFSKRLFDEKDIMPTYYCSSEYHPNYADEDLVFVTDHGVLNSLYTDINRKGENYKETVCTLNDLMLKNSNYTRVSDLMDGSFNFRFDGVYDSVTNLENTEFKKFDLHY